MDVFFSFFGIFTMHVYQNCHTEQAVFGFHTPDNYYKPHYNLLVPHIHLTATLHMLKNDKTHFFMGLFGTFGVSDGSTHANMGQKGYFLIYT